MELDIQRSKLNSVAQINYSNSKMKIKEENKENKINVQSFLSLSLYILSSHSFPSFPSVVSCPISFYL